MDPTEGAWSTQYRSAIFYGSPAQEAAAKKARDALEAKLGKKVTTAIEKLERFWIAEDYHQKYVLQSRREIAREVRARYPSFQAFNDSTVAARLNAWLAGNGEHEAFERDVRDCEVSKDVAEALRARMGRPAKKTCGAGD